MISFATGAPPFLEGRIGRGNNGTVFRGRFVRTAAWGSTYDGRRATSEPARRIGQTVTACGMPICIYIRGGTADGPYHHI